MQLYTIFLHTRRRMASSSYRPKPEDIDFEWLPCSRTLYETLSQRKLHIFFYDKITKFHDISLHYTTLDGGEWSASLPGRALPPGKGPPVPIGQEAGWA
jgi:hypothetical protein